MPGKIKIKAVIGYYGYFLLILLVYVGLPLAAGYFFRNQIDFYISYIIMFVVNALITPVVGFDKLIELFEKNAKILKKSH